MSIICLNQFKRYRCTGGAMTAMADKLGIWACHLVFSQYGFCISYTAIRKSQMTIINRCQRMDLTFHGNIKLSLTTRMLIHPIVQPESPLAYMALFGHDLTLDFLMHPHNYITACLSKLNCFFHKQKIIYFCTRMLTLW